jgi:hypothetical protein
MPETPKKPAFSVVSPDATGIPPPRPLLPDGRALWDAVMKEYAIRDAGGLELLCEAAQALDRAQELAGAIAADGAIIYGKSGPRAHPGVKDELACRAFVVRTLERLGLNIEALKPGPGRPTQPLGWIPPEQR